TQINLGAAHKTDLKNGQTSVNAGFNQNLGAATLSGTGTATIDNHKKVDLQGGLNLVAPVAPNTNVDLGVLGKTGQKPTYTGDIKWEKEINDRTKLTVAAGHQTNGHDGRTKVEAGLQTEVGKGTLGLK
ncbi:hypothetical protein PMAYCL1PPCAC_20648, partial [Pristionchus mayeri]